MKKRIALGSFALVVVIGALPYVIGDSERRALTDAVRAEEYPDEQFVKLSDGVTHYEWAGPDDGEVVVFVHGFSSPSFIWDKQFSALADAGFRVLRYDQFGRGLSDRPNVTYDADLYDRQLLELLDTFKVTEPVNLVGLSMGGATTIGFTGRHPERVRRIALMAPAGFTANVPAVAQLLRVPGLSTWLMKAIGDRIIQKSIDTMASENPEVTDVIRAEYAKQMQYYGYKRALHSTLLHYPLQSLENEYQRAGELNKPAALFWGDNDLVVPFAHHARVQELIPHIEFHPVPGAGHTVNYERPDVVNPALIAFLKRVGTLRGPAETDPS